MHFELLAHYRLYLCIYLFYVNLYKGASKDFKRSTDTLLCVGSGDTLAVD